MFVKCFEIPRRERLEEGSELLLHVVGEFLPAPGMIFLSHGIIYYRGRWGCEPSSQDGSCCCFPT